MESRSGFAGQPPVARADTETAAEWPDWRGPKRDAISDDVPRKLPAKKRLLWSRTLTGPGMSGLAVDSGRVVVADKDLDEEHDVFRCLDADVVKDGGTFKQITGATISSRAVTHCVARALEFFEANRGAILGLEESAEEPETESGGSGQ